MTKADASKGNTRAVRCRFLADCLFDFHQAVLPHGLAHDGMLLVRELLPVGYEALRDYYDSTDIRLEFISNDVFEDFMVMLAIDFGLVHGLLWHANRCIPASVAESVANRGPLEAAGGLVETLFDQPLMDDRGAPLYDLIYVRFCAMIAPHRDAPDARTYVLLALTAAFQLGVTLMLERCDC